MEIPDLKVYRNTHVCARCMSRRKSVRGGAASKNQIVLGLAITVSFSFVISFVSICLYRSVQVEVSRGNVAIEDLRAQVHALTDKLNRLERSEINKRHGGENVVQSDLVLKDKQELQSSYNTDTPSSVETKNHFASLGESSKETGARVSNHKIVKRANKGEKNKRCKKRKCKQKSMTYIQIEGSGTEIIQDNKNAVTGFWNLPAWLSGKPNPRIKSVNKAFQFNEINKTGKLRVKKAGMYLVYAQFTLVGNPTTGFHVSLSHGKNTEKILECTHMTNSGTYDNTQTCFSMKIVQLKANQTLFVQENQTNTGANYSKISYFGLLRIGD